MIVGYKELDKKLRKLSKIDLRKVVGRATLYVQENAKANCNTFKQSTGELKNSIFVSLKGGGDVVTGTCYTNKKYAPYVEFGTGPVGQTNHKGISPDITPAYSQKGWMIPGEAMDRDKAERYGLGVVEGKDGEPIGYLTNGQPAHPFLYPALKDNEKRISDLVAEEIRRQL